MKEWIEAQIKEITEVVIPRLQADLNANIGAKQALEATLAKYNEEDAERALTNYQKQKSNKVEEEVA